MNNRSCFFLFFLFFFTVYNAFGYGEILRFFLTAKVTHSREFFDLQNIRKHRQKRVFTAVTDCSIASPLATEPEFEKLRETQGAGPDVA